MSKTKVALLGTGFIANIHAERYARFVHDAEVVASMAATRRTPKPSPPPTAFPPPTATSTSCWPPSRWTWWTSACPTTCTTRPA